MQDSRIMIGIVRTTFVGILCCVACNCVALDLIGSASVNVTSDTATAAKERAFDSARRQIIPMALRGVADSAAVSNAVRGASSSELADLISASTIEGERTSNTSYSANITMTLDTVATRAWLNSHNIQNWIDNSNSVAVSVDNNVAYVTITYGLSDWIMINRIARDSGVNISTRSILGNQITVEIPSNARKKFVSGLVASGWRYADHGSIIQIWR